MEELVSPPLPLLSFVNRALGVRCHLDLVEFGFRYPASFIGLVLEDSQQLLLGDEKYNKSVMSGLTGPNVLEMRYFSGKVLTMVGEYDSCKEVERLLDQFRAAKEGEPKKTAFKAMMDARMKKPIVTK